MKTIRIGIIGGGLMGREIASAFARWCSLADLPISPQIVALTDPNPDARSWFEKNIPTLKTITASHTEMLEKAAPDVVYVAVPHHLHKSIYLDVLDAGCDLLAEKPFGIDLPSAKAIQNSAIKGGNFVRCSSEFPFFPGAQRVLDYVRSGACGRILEATSGFHHSSDLDSTKPANWKRQSETCGEIGVLGDLGLHALHLPLRLKWNIRSLYAQLQKGFPERPNGQGGMTPCDTWDNATLHTWIEQKEGDFPLRIEMKRLAPGATNTWFIEVRGTQGGIRYSTAKPKTLEIFEPGKEQFWKSTDLGFQTPFPTITGGIFELGFPDLIQQMWASYLLDREGLLDGRFSCATVPEAVNAHQIYAAALQSQSLSQVVHV